MSRSVFTNTVGLLGAIVAFGLGWVLKSRPESADSSAAMDFRPVGAVSSSSPPLLQGAHSERAETDGADPRDAGSAMQSARRTSRSGPLSTIDIDELGRVFRTSLDPVERSLAFTKLLKGLTEENALEIRRQIAHLEPKSREFQEFHQAWGKIAGAEAVLFGATTMEPDMAPALAGWASADPGAAREWLNNLDMANHPGFDVLLNDQGIPPYDLKGRLVEGLVRGLANADLDLAASHVYDLAAAGDGQAKSLMRMITDNVIENMGLEEAIAWAASLPGGRMQGAATERVVENWGTADASSALDWAASLGELDGGPALSAAFAKWGAGQGGGDPMAASRALQDMAPSRNRDYAINGFISGLAGSDPQGAIIWAQEIESAGMREAAVVRAAERYYDIDPVGAAQWLALVDLPESTRRKLSDSFFQ